MAGVCINAAAVVLGSLLGLLLKKGIPEKMADAVMTAIGLCVLYIGADGALSAFSSPAVGEELTLFKGETLVLLILAMATGAFLGGLADLDRQFNRLGSFIQSRLQKADGKAPIAEGFVTGSLLFCVGAMAVTGSIQAGLTGDISVLLTKSLLDFISAAMLSVSLGIGVSLAAIPVFLYQGAFVLLARIVAPVLTESMIAEMTCAGNLMIVALSLNMLKIGKFKVANLLPGLLTAPVLTALFALFG